MSIPNALAHAKKARRLAPPELYSFARNLEKAIEELANSLPGDSSFREAAADRSQLLSEPEILSSGTLKKY